MDMQPIRLFLVDDCGVIRDGLRALLAANPDMLVVGEAADGVEAVGQVERLRPDVVIMDISTPELEGIEATERILERCPQVRVIILSMLGTLNHFYRALEAGARGYLLKESAGRELIDAVLAVHAGRLYLSQPVSNAMITEYLRYRADPRA